ncbi:hypothetical protein [Glycomyces sp. NPDC047010]|uniref:hypothetical protein n=1 Tax=Glycomyces sp. NPDC047010 TaxID=3155023 RepID=UPI0033F27863
MSTCGKCGASMPQNGPSLYFCTIECQEQFQQDVPLVGGPRHEGPTTIPCLWQDLTDTLADELQWRLRPYLDRAETLWSDHFNTATEDTLIAIDGGVEEFEGGAEEAGLARIADGLAALAHESGGVNFAGHHWCFARGHNGIPAIDPPGPGRLAYTTHLSDRPGRNGTHDRSGTAAVLTAHQPCCPRTSTITDPKVDTAPVEAFAEAMDAHLVAATRDRSTELGPGPMTQHWRVCSCLGGCLPGDGGWREAPVDIVFISGDDLAREYWELFRAHHFQVRVMNPLDFIPGPEDTIVEDVDLWTLRRAPESGGIELGIDGHGPVVLSSDHDTNRLRMVTELLPAWRR